MSKKEVSERERERARERERESQRERESFAVTPLWFLHLLLLGVYHSSDPQEARSCLQLQKSIKELSLGLHQPLPGIDAMSGARFWRFGVGIDKFASLQQYKSRVFSILFFIYKFGSLI